MCFYNDIYKITILVEKWGFLEIRFLIRFSDSTLMSIKYIFSTYFFYLFFRHTYSLGRSFRNPDSGTNCQLRIKRRLRQAALKVFRMNRRSQVMTRH